MKEMKTAAACVQLDNYAVLLYSILVYFAALSLRLILSLFLNNSAHRLLLTFHLLYLYSLCSTYTFASLRSCHWSLVTHHSAN
jgi:hypothetical protein